MVLQSGTVPSISTRWKRLRRSHSGWHPVAARAQERIIAFEGALHVWSDAGTASEKGLVEWNSESLWKSDYQGMASGLLCFAEDVFGMQF